MKTIGMQHQSPRSTHLGGSANNGSRAGVFYWNVNNLSSNRNRNIGAHVNPPLTVKMLVPGPLLEYVATKSLVEQSNNSAGGCRT
jgi:hypothetical protein